MDRKRERYLRLGGEVHRSSSYYQWATRSRHWWR